MSNSDFEILSKLGDGAFSSVFKVMRKSDGQFYALKKVKLGALKQKEKENALNEVRILASVYHPNIIAYKEAFVDEPTNTLCIVMELAESGDLLKKISNHKAARTFFPENEIWTTLVHVTQGLKILHDAKILHRDLKCANIFISKDGINKLGDLNVSKVNKRGLAYTQTGTPYYASPEVWKDQPYNSSSDIWSLGCVIYEMAALVPPFTASDMQGLYKKIIRGVYPNVPSQYSSDLSNVIRTLLQVNPTLRPTCEKILEMPPVQRHICIQLMPNPQAADLLGTIKFEPGKNMKQKLPAPNYDSRNRGMSAHSSRPKVESAEPPGRVASARGGREVKGQNDANRPPPRVPDKPEVRAPRVDPYAYKPQVKDQGRYPVKNDIYEPLAKKVPGNIGAPIGELYRIPEAKADYNPYNAPYRPDKYVPSYADPKPVSKNPSHENLYKPSNDLGYMNSPPKPEPYRPGNAGQYINKPPSRDRPSNYAPLAKESPKVPSYIEKREVPPSREKVPSYMEKREVPPSRDKVPSYMEKRDAPPSRDKPVYPEYRAPSREAAPVKPSYQYNPPSSRGGQVAPYTPAYKDVQVSREAPASRDRYQPPRDLNSREKQYGVRESSSREAQRAPAPYVPPRNAPASREGRPGSREAENKNFNRIGALVLQSPKQLVPKAMPSPASNNAVRPQYLQQGGRQQRINPVWWG